jgi:membrane protein DedA with SNARE-associated domain
MDWHRYLAEYGYLAVLAGCFFEGETVLMLAGAAAGAGLMVLPGVVAAAAAGGFLTDNTAFHVGRLGGASLVARSPRLARLQPAVHARLARNALRLGFGVRFAVGLRTAVPVVMGASRVSPLAFAVANGGGAFAWAAGYGAAGYALGPRLTDLVRGALEWVPAPVAAVLFIVTTVGVTWLLLRQARKDEAEDADDRP